MAEQVLLYSEWLTEIEAELGNLGLEQRDVQMVLVNLGLAERYMNGEIPKQVATDLKNNVAAPKEQDGKTE